MSPKSPHTPIDPIAGRGQTLGGVAVGDPRHVAKITAIPSRRTSFEVGRAMPESPGKT